VTRLFGWKAKESGFAFQEGQDIFLFFTASRMVLGSTSLLSSAYQCNEAGIYLYLHSIIYAMGRCSIKHRDNFSYYLFTKPILTTPDEDFYSMSTASSNQQLD
jgi:hypothetical protein